jgi:hypothetical protein
MAGNKTFRAGFRLLEGLVNNDDVVLMGLKRPLVAKRLPAFPGSSARSPQGNPVES